MRHPISKAAAGALFWLAGTAAAADDNKVVVELFTSQGCSSCPPADAMLGELAERDDVIPLALHVDYWDYIGWADIFADPAYTRRQKGYAHATGQRMVYTPQMVIDGQDHVIGSRPMEVLDLIRAHQEQAQTVSISLEVEGDMLDVSITSTGAVSAPCIVQLVRYEPQETVEIETGENAGRTLDYVNIVTSWEVIGEWDGVSDFEAKVAHGGTNVAIIVQHVGYGPILAAAARDLD